LGQEIVALAAQDPGQPALSSPLPAHWLATKLLENDEAILEAMEAQGQTDLLERLRPPSERIEAATGEDAETLIADQRYTFIGEHGGVLERPSTSMFTTSDKIDEIVTHRIWGLPIFLLMMWLVFQFTANVSAPFLDWVDVFINETIYGWGVSLMAAWGWANLAGRPDHRRHHCRGGRRAGVCAGAALPLFALAVLEDSGYMARAAFVMDRVMRWMGLHGKSFLPMIVGFGCTVPAVYATRTLENEKDRKLTGFLATFMSCGARLPVYVVFGAAFFGTASGNLIFAMYMLGIAVALATGFALKHTSTKANRRRPFVMELPPYRAPRAA
jgi:ferrous iron transport protein B